MFLVVLIINFRGKCVYFTYFDDSMIYKTSVIYVRRRMEQPNLQNIDEKVFNNTTMSSGTSCLISYINALI